DRQGERECLERAARRSRPEVRLWSGDRAAFSGRARAHHGRSRRGSIGKSHGRGTMMVRELVKQARELIRRNRSGVLAPEVLTPEGFGSLNARRLIVARVAMAH